MKGIDKKACRSFLNPRRSLDLNSGLFYVEQIEYIVCTAIRIVGHRKLLILDFYPRAEAVKGMPSPDFTMFQATDDFITFDHRDGVKTLRSFARLNSIPTKNIMNSIPSSPSSMMMPWSFIILKTGSINIPATINPSRSGCFRRVQRNVAAPTANITIDKSLLKNPVSMVFLRNESCPVVPALQVFQKVFAR